MLTGLTAFWLEQHRRHLPQPPRLLHRRARGVRAAARCWSSGSRWCRSSASCAATSRARAGRTTRPPAPSAGSSCRTGLHESEQLPEPIFTPATKAEIGDHDENVDFDRAAEIVGDRALLEELRRLSIAIYERGAAHARERGIILADTKFEFGRRADGTIVLGDEVLTPDSSRFWPADGYEPGRGQPSFDKQYVRDWASGSGWDKAPPAPGAPRRRRRGHPRALRRGLRAHRRRAVRRAGWSARA